MELTLFSPGANQPLAAATAGRLGASLGSCRFTSFRNGEPSVTLHESIRGRDVYLIQSMIPLDKRFLELFYSADACRRDDAARLTAVLPYFGYSRTQPRSDPKNRLPASWLMDLWRGVGIDRVVTVDAGSDITRDFGDFPLENVSATPWLLDAVSLRLPPKGVLVMHDAAAGSTAGAYASSLNLPWAVVEIERTRGGRLRITIHGDVERRSPILVDNTIGDGTAILATGEALLQAGCSPSITVVATHGELTAETRARLDQLPLRAVIVTDSVCHPPATSLPLHVVSLDCLLAETISRLHGTGTRAPDEVVLHLQDA